MTLWIDAQLSPDLARWFQQRFGVAAMAVRDLGLREADDEVIFAAARHADAIVLTKDSDFVGLLDQHGPPPQVVWLTCGNTSNTALTRLLDHAWPAAVQMLMAGEPLVEISDRQSDGT